MINVDKKLELEENKVMPFSDHLDELRQRLLNSIYSIFISIFISFLLIKPIINFLEIPASKIRLLQLSPGEFLFVAIKIAGYSGLLVHIDEMVNILRINHTQTRTNNYEMVLKIINDVMQSNNNNLGFYLSGTPEFLTDYRRGLYSYEALKSRLEENTFLSNNLFFRYAYA